MDGAGVPCRVAPLTLGREQLIGLTHWSPQPTPGPRSAERPVDVHPIPYRSTPRGHSGADTHNDPLLGCSIYHPSSRVNTGREADPLLAIAEPIACTDAHLCEAFVSVAPLIDL